jgi:hypothetical protein
MEVTIVDDQGSHLLIGQNGRFAVIERRNNLLYSCHGEHRRGVALDDIAELGTILDDADWTDEAVAKATFNEIVARGAHLGETMR